MKDEQITNLKLEINSLIWMHAPKELTLQKAEDLACRILYMIMDGEDTIKEGVE